MKLNLNQLQDKKIKAIIFAFILGFITIIFIAYQQRTSKNPYINKANAAAFDSNLGFASSIDEKMLSLQNNLHNQVADDFIVNSKQVKESKQTQTIIDNVVISDEVKNFVLGDNNFIKDSVYYQSNIVDSGIKKPQSVLKTQYTNLKNEVKERNEKVASQVLNQRQADFIKAISSDMNVVLANTNYDKTQTDTKVLTGNINSFTQYSNLQQHNYRNNNQVEDVDTPYLLRQGTIIPAILLSSINSDIQGQVIAQVTDDVLDSPYGYYVLIPRGSKLIGQYQIGLAMGQERLVLGFNRIIFPDSKALDIGVQIAADTDGIAGLSADVDNHFFRILKNSLLLAAVRLGSNRVNSSIDESLAYEYGQYNSNIIGSKVDNILSSNINISPTLKVQSGYLFNVTLTQDFRFKGEYIDYDYENKFN